MFNPFDNSQSSESEDPENGVDDKNIDKKLI